jgi:hypothetical protein
MAVELMTREEARAFADKLEEFALALPAKEQALLHEILVRAAGANEDDVEGHALLGASIATVAMAAAAAIGVTVDANAMHIIAALQAQSDTHSTNSSQWLDDERGGLEHAP